MAANIKMKSIVLSLMTVFLMACSLGGLLPGSDDNAASDVFRSEAGGYSFNPLEGYDLTEEIGITQMLEPGAEPVTGPMIAMIGGPSEEEMDTETLLEKMTESMSDVTISKAKKVKVGGATGLDVGLESTLEDEDTLGRMVVVMVEPNQQFVMLAVAPKDDWKTFNKDFEKVLKSIEFFTPAQIVVEEPEGEPAAVVEPGITTPGATPDPGTSTGTGEMQRQWAVSAVASSQYAEEGWSAKQATGEPNVGGCDDDVFAWASLYSNTVEWIELTYETAVIPYEVTVVQTYNPSQVVDITGIADDGSEYLIWESEPEVVAYCPDFLTISVEPDKEVYINKLRITIDQTVLGLGWNEIDAVELVGIPRGGTGFAPPAAAPVAPAPAPGSAGGGNTAGGEVPTGKGFLTTDLYQAYLSIPINEVADLEPLIGPLKSSSGQLKPRPDHKDTFVFDIGGGMQAYASITTSGLIYKKNIGQILPVDMGVEFDRSTYDMLYQMQKDTNYQLPYTLVAQILGSPGLVIWHQIQDDGKMRIEYQWFNSKGDRMWVAAYDGLITGSAGISFVPKE